MIYTVGGIKGGSGKTTLATNLVVHLSKLGADVLLVDADAQETSMQFVASRFDTLGKHDFAATKLNNKQVQQQVPQLATKYDHVVIDTGGRDTISQRMALMVTDVYLLPFLPRSFDLWTLDDVKAVIEEMQASRQHPFQSYSFLNRGDSRGPENEQSAELLRKYEPLITYVPATISNRKSFANAGTDGLGVEELSPKDKKAIAEINFFFTTLNDLIHASKTAVAETTI